MRVIFGICALMALITLVLPVFVITGAALVLCHVIALFSQDDWIL